MVAGCAMGAGCLAMPMLAAGPNFIFSSFFLVLTSILSYLIASISLEIFLLYKNDVNTSTIVTRNFGYGGTIFSALINVVLMYAILSVYMTGGADLLDKTILPLVDLHISTQLSLIIFLTITVPIFLKGAMVVVKSNKIIFILKLITFLVAVLLGLKFISPNLANFSWDQLRYIPKALPIFLAALWFHFLIPVIARINGYDRERCRQIFAVGLILPVILYVLWIAIMLSLIPRDGLGHTFLMLLKHEGSVGTMINYATHNNPNLSSLMKVALNLFSNIAMLTSFLTVGVALYDYVRDALKIQQTKSGVLGNLLLTMLPPALFALFYPNGFVFILQQASILIMVINLMMLACCLKEYANLEEKPTKLLIWSLSVILVILISLQVLDNFSLLPSFGK